MGRWNLLRAAMIGAAFGAAYAVLMIVTGDGPSNTVRAAGQVIGSAAGAAVVFGLVAGARNLIVRAK